VENNISALRFLYKKTLKRRNLAFDDLPFPKQPRTLPTLLSQDEVTRLIEATTNRMHRMLLMLLYSTGSGAASLLKVSDIDSQRMVIHIHRGKGMRDRDVPLTPKMLEALRELLPRPTLANSGSPSASRKCCLWATVTWSSACPMRGCR